VNDHRRQQWALLQRDLHTQSIWEWERKPTYCCAGALKAILGVWRVSFIEMGGCLPSFSDDTSYQYFNEDLEDTSTFQRFAPEEFKGWIKTMNN